MGDLHVFSRNDKPMTRVRRAGGIRLLPGRGTPRSRATALVAALSLMTAGLVTLSLTDAATARAASSAASVSGQVTNQQGQPVPDVNVSLLYQQPSGTCRSVVINPVVTDASGNYTLGAVPAGSYRVQYSSAYGSGYPNPQYYQHTADYSAATDITLSVGQTLSGIDDALVAGGTITGTVSDATHPLAGIEVQASGVNGGFVPTTTTGADGTYTVSGVTPGTVKVYFTDPSEAYGFQWYQGVVTTSGAATAVTVTDGQTTPGIDVTLSPAGAISGTVTDSGGTPLTNIQADGYPSDGSAGGFAFGNSSNPTGASGGYTVRGLPTTNYHVNFRDTTGTYASSSYPSTVSVTAPGTTSAINAQLQAGGRIAGTVTDSGGHPIPNVSINAYDQTGQYGFASTAADGTYTVHGLGASGGYRVSFNVPGISTQFYYQNTTSYSAATLVSVTAGQTTSGIDLNVASTGCAATTTTISSSSNPAAVDDAVTFTATVAPSSGTGVPSGDVTFQDNGKAVAVSSVDGAGQATFTTSALAKGSHSISAVYSGDTTYASSTGTLNQSITPIATTATLTAGPNPTALHAPATFTATVSPASGTSAPTGTVTFTDGTTQLGSAPLNGSGVATLTTSSLAVGSHTVTADYPGDGKHSASTSNSVTQTVTTIATTTTVTSDANPATAGQIVTFTGTVAPATGSAAPTGQLTFNDGSTVLGTASLNAAGTATLATSQLSSGTHTITATYSADPSFAASTSDPLTETVGSGTGTTATSTTLDSSNNPAAYGQWVTYTAQVLPAAGSGTPSGTVRLTDGAAPAQTATLDSSGQATFTLSSLSVGDHALTASYVGDTGYAASDSAPLTQTISRAPTGVTLTTSAEPVTAGAPLTLTAAVSATAAYSGIAPGGTVDFTDGTAVLANVPLDARGVARLDTTGLSLGTHTLTVNYLGSTGFTPASSSTLAEDVITAAAGVRVTVKNSDGTTVAGAMIVIALPDGSTITGSTGSDGAVVLVGVPDGSYNVDALAAPDQVPGQAPVTVTGGTGDATVTLSGGSLTKLTMDATGPLTPDQLTAAGIDPNDPNNSHVEQFITTIPNVGTLCGFTNNTGLVSGSVHCDYPISPPPGGGSATVSAGGRLYTVSGSGNQVGVLESPGVKFLKEFFNVRETVFNLAGPSFPFTHGVASLALPAGLSLAPSSPPQTSTPAVADVPGGGSASASWIVRGDTEGLYTLTGSYQGLLQPFGSPVHVTGTSATPLHVWGGAALKMIVQADTSVYAHHPYRVRIGLQNVADTSVYNASVGLAPQVGPPEYLFQPRQQMTFTTPQIDPGQTWWTDNYELLSPNTSAIDLSRAFVRAVGGDVTLASTVTGQAPLYTPQTVPKLTGTGQVNAVSLNWDPIAGATGYEVFTTPTDLTPFSASPVAAVGATTTNTSLPAAGGTSSWYAVTALVDGHETMFHPMVQVTALTPPPPPPAVLPPSISPAAGASLGSGTGGLATSTTHKRAEPVDTATGAYTTSHSDLRMYGLGVAFDFTRTYNSNDPATGPLGAGWTATPFSSVHVNDDGSVMVRAGDGQQATFLRRPDGTFTGLPGVTAQLGELSTGWSLVTRDHLHYTFDVAGNLLAVTDRNGSGVTIQRQHDQVSTVTDAAGRQVTFSYDSQGRLARLLLPDGRTTTYGYDADGGLAAVTDPAGAVTGYRYTDAGLLDQITDPDGHVALTNTYDRSSRIIRQVNALDQTATFDWDATSGTSTYTDPAGHAWKDVYDNFLLTTQVDPLGRATHYRYDASHDRVGITDPAGRTTSIDYTTDGKPTSVTAADGAVVASLSYGSNGEVTTATDGGGHTTHYSYDVRGNLIGTQMPSGSRTSYTRDQVTGAVTASRDANGHVTAYRYDAAGNLVQRVSPMREITSFAYDQVGRLITEVDPRGNLGGVDPARYTTRYGYDAGDRLVSASDPLQHTSTRSYDPAGRLLAVADPAGRTSHYGYDPMGQLTDVTAADGARTRYGYDAAGNIASRSDAKGHTTNYRYDAADQLTRISDPLGRVTGVGYNPDGTVDSTRDATGTRTELTYDQEGRVTGEHYSDATPTVTFTYSTAGQRASMTDGAGTVNYRYNADGQLTGVTRGRDTFAYGLDAAGALISRRYPDGAVISLGRDADGRVTRLATGGKTSTFTYNAASQLTATTTPDGYTEGRHYDVAGRLTSVASTRSGHTLVSYGYTYDNAGNPTAMAVRGSALPNETDAYTYDAVNRLTAACYGRSSSRCSGGREQFSYDPVGNRSSLAATTRTGRTTTTEYQYDAADQLTGIGRQHLSYDGDGRLIADGARAFRYNANGQMTGITDPSGASLYTYDGDGNRLSAQHGRSTSTFVWDIDSGLPALALERSDRGPSRRYIAGVTGALSTTTGRSTSYYHHDGLGSITTLTSDRGQLLETYAYGAFGTRRIAHQVKGPNNNPLQYAGSYRELNGLYYLHARELDTVLGRFTAPDPLGERGSGIGDSGYAYVGDRPTRYVDPSGTTAQKSGGLDSEGIGPLDAASYLTTYSDGISTLLAFGKGDRLTARAYGDAYIQDLLGIACGLLCSLPVVNLIPGSEPGPLADIVNVRPARYPFFAPELRARTLCP
jgi:RHS repeat-associated protein